MDQEKSFFNRNPLRGLLGPGSEWETDMWMYCEESSNEWVQCELLHEFLDAYQIVYYSNNSSVEAVVGRDRIREISNEQRMDS